MSQGKHTAISKTDTLESRMKWYESRFTNDVFMPMAPVMARLDGRSFSSFTRGLKKPYDERLSKLMIDTTKYLVEQSDARCGYTQSDEISLVWLAEDWNTDIFFAGKIQKMNSVLASMATAYFNKNLIKVIPERSDAIPLFDCRVFQVPEAFEAVNCFIWREQDAARNSVQMAARANFSHGQCENKKCRELVSMLAEKGIRWEEYPRFFKRGTYVRQRHIEREFTPSELESLPPKHASRKNPDLKVKRKVVMEEDFPMMSWIENREDVILHGKDPILLDRSNI
jgi:tRNA(His) 5'-end guanylyltransferase